MKSNPIKDKSFAFALRIVALSRELGERKQFVLAKQILRSGTSIGSNVREALNGESRKDFAHKLHIAQKEADETCYWLELLHQSSEIDQATFESYYTDAKEIIKILVSIITTTRKS